MSREIELPPLVKRAWLGVQIEPGALAGSHVFVVTVHEGAGRAPRRRWFADRQLALLHAADQADALNLPIFDRAALEGAE